MQTRGVLLYGAGQLGVMLVARYFFQWLIRFADAGKDTASGALLSAGLVGAVFLGFRVFDAVADPLAGAFGDAWVARGRERRQLIWTSFLLPAIGVALVFAPSHHMSPALRWALACAGMLVFFIGYTLYAIPYWALLEDYAQGNARDRTRLSNVLGVGVLLATAFGFVVSPLLIARLGFLSGALIFGAVGTVLMALPYFASPKASAVQATARAVGAPSMSVLLRSAVMDRRFVALIALYAGAQMSFTIMTAAAPFIAERLLGGSLTDVAKLLGPFLLGALASFTFVPRLSRRFGWERATVIATVALGLAYSGAGLLGAGIVGSPLTTAMLVFAAAGPGAAVILGLEGEAIARCAQASEHQSTAAYFGVFNFVVKGLNGLALSLVGVLADMESIAAIRAMPMFAGALCVVGVIAYGMLQQGRRQGTAAQP